LPKTKFQADEVDVKDEVEDKNGNTDLENITIKDEPLDSDEDKGTPKTSKRMKRRTSRSES